MPNDMKQLYEERLGRYQAAIALEPTDRVPIAPGTNYFAEVHTGNTNQETMYDPEKWLQAEVAFARDFPEVDVLRSNRMWGPMYDAVGFKLYKLPGRDLPPRVQFQFVEQEYMMPDEYPLLIENPTEFLMSRFLPRVFGELAEPGSTRSHIAFLKAGMAHATYASIMRNRAVYLQTELGLPQPMTGYMLAPFDYIADTFRGLKGVTMDVFRQPDNVIRACDAIVSDVVHAAIATADPLKRYPIFMPLHKGIFLSPRQYDRFYWPSLKKAMLLLIESGYTIRAYLEGNYAPYWHHIQELPKGKVLCDIDNEGDIVKAKEAIGGYQCIAGGVPDSLLILGTPDEVYERSKLLCQTVAQDGGFIISGGCNMPYHTKPENFRAMVDATMEYGRYDDSIKPKPKPAPEVRVEIPGLDKQRMVTPWEVKRAELGEIPGDEGLIQRPWETLEAAAYNWLWTWML